LLFKTLTLYFVITPFVRQGGSQLKEALVAVFPVKFGRAEIIPGSEK
jgi:hypothetical protein